MRRTSDHNADLGCLMARAQAGDEAAYLDLLRKISPVVRSAAKRQARSLQNADLEDVVQDVLVSVHLVRATYDPSRPFLPWLLTIVRNRLIDRYRKFRRGAANEILVDEVPETLSSFWTNPQLEAFADEEHLRKAIQALPPAQRRAVELLKLKEMSLKQASAETGLTVGNLKVLVHRAVKSLRKGMSAGHED